MARLDGVEVLGSAQLCGTGSGPTGLDRIRLARARSEAQTAGVQAERLLGAARGGRQGCRRPYVPAEEQGLGDCFQLVSEIKGLWRGNPLIGSLLESTRHCCRLLTQATVLSLPLLHN